MNLASTLSMVVLKINFMALTGFRFKMVLISSTNCKVTDHSFIFSKIWQGQCLTSFVSPAMLLPHVIGMSTRMQLIGLISLFFKRAFNSGSSGGTAALIAARGVSAGFCTDTSGSCRNPASVTGNLFLLKNE